MDRVANKNRCRTEEMLFNRLHGFVINVNSLMRTVILILITIAPTPSCTPYCSRVVSHLDHGIGIPGVPFFSEDW